MSDDKQEIPSVEEFETEAASGSRRGVLRPLVRFVKRLRIRAGVGASKEVAGPARSLEKSETGQSPQTKGSGPDASSAPRARHIEFREGVRRPPRTPDQDH